MKFQIAGLLAFLGSATGAFVDTCALQSPCVKFTVDKIAKSTCTGDDFSDATRSCDFKICMDVDISNEGCGKDFNTESISHGCALADGSQCSDFLGMPTADSTSCPAMVGYESSFSGKCEGIKQTKFCTVVGPGGFAYFNLKDANSQSEDGLTVSNAKSVGKLSGGCAADGSYIPDLLCNNNLARCGGGDIQNARTRTWKIQAPYCDQCEDPGDEPEDPGDELPSSTTKTNGDPHFMTWKKEHFEFHGQCDILLAKDDEFADGLGLNVQARTKVVRHWSYNKNIAIQIGDEILEVEGGPNSAIWWYNYERLGELGTIGGFPIIHTVKSEWKQMFEIDLDSKYPGHRIVLSTYKEFVRLDFQGDSEEAYGNAVGILGDYKTGKTLARDGSTVLDDFVEYGQEWQVLPADIMLFHMSSDPQFPEKCIQPIDPRGERRRRLGEVSVSEEQAEAACAHLKDAMDRKDCVYDILATQDIGMVGAY